MGTASTMQIMAEALGLMLGSAADARHLGGELKVARWAGKRAAELAFERMTARRMVTLDSF